MIMQATLRVSIENWQSL